MRIAVIDLGTNTFSLLLAQINPDNNYSIILSNKQAAKIGEGGIIRRLITPEATARAIQVLNGFISEIYGKGGSDRIIAIATSAVRTAENKIEFISEIKKYTGIDVHVISGDDEAMYIYEGVKQTVDTGNEIILTLDIGGGSNEFIIANKYTVYWKHSFPLGIARILEIFQPENPIKPDTLEKVENYFDEQLYFLWNEAKKYSVKTLIGSSGSFETYRSLLTGVLSCGSLSCNIPLEDYFRLHEKLVKSTAQERKQMKGMELMRVEMIVLASVFTNFVVRKLGIQGIIQSDYSLKEGVMKLFAEGKFIL